MHRFFLLHHKCGTVYLELILQDLAETHDWGCHIAGSAKQLDLGPEDAGDAIWFVKNSAYAALFGDREGGYRGVHVVRDPRDVIVSGYFSHRYSHPVDNAWGEGFLIDHRKRLEALSVEEGLCAEIELGYSLGAMKAWRYDDPAILELRFEELIAAPQVVLTSAFAHLEQTVEPTQLAAAIERRSFKNLSGGRNQGQENQRSHFRKGVPGDWRNYFTPAVIDAFKQRWGKIAVELGYEPTNDWSA
ncbi:MAG: sulfotransferase domain-containing protein [Planctomycetota bacterium]